MSAYGRRSDGREMLKIVILSDLHLVAPGIDLPRMDTTARFGRALEMQRRCIRMPIFASLPRHCRSGGGLRLTRFSTRCARALRCRRL